MSLKHKISGIALNNWLRLWRIRLNLQYFFNAFETVSPSSELLFDALPFFCGESEWLYRLYNNNVIDLVYLSLEDSVTHSIDNPLFHLVLSDGQKSRHLLEFHWYSVTLVLCCTGFAELDVLFLLQNERFFDLLLLHECFVGSEFFLESSHVLLHEQIDEGEELFVGGLDVLDEVQDQNFFEVEDLWGLDSVDYHSLNSSKVFGVSFDSLLLILSGSSHHSEGLEEKLECSLAFSLGIKSISAIGVELDSLILEEGPISRDLNNILNLLDHNRSELPNLQQISNHMFEHLSLQGGISAKHEIQVEECFKDGVAIKIR